MIDYLSPKFSIYFTDGFDTTLSSNTISILRKDSTEIPFSIRYINNAALEIKVDTELKPKTNYSISLNMKYFVDLAGNKADTVISKRIVTVSGLDFSGVSGCFTSCK